MGSSMKSGLYIVQIKGVKSNYSKSFKLVKNKSLNFLYAGPDALLLNQTATPPLEKRM
jgi:hypothetical protein